MRCLAAVSLATILMSAGAAQAQEASDSDTPEIVQEWGQRPHLWLLEEVDLTLGGSDDIDLTQLRLSWLLRLSVRSRLTIDMGLGLSRTTMDLFTPRDAQFYATIEMPWRGYFEARTTVLLLKRRYLDFSIYAEVTLPFGSDEPEIASLQFDGIAADIGIPLDEANAAVNLTDEWHRVDVGLTLRGLLGRWRPLMSLRYVHLPRALHIGITDPGIEALLRLADAMPSSEYDLTIRTVFFTLGLDVELGAGFRLEARIAAAPLGIDKHEWLLMSRFGVVMPLSPHPRYTWNPPPRRRTRRSR